MSNSKNSKDAGDNHQGGNESPSDVGTTSSSLADNINSTESINSLSKAIIEAITEWLKSASPSKSNASIGFPGSESKSSTPKVANKTEVHLRDTSIEGNSSATASTETFSESENLAEVSVMESNIPGPNEPLEDEFFKLFNVEQLKRILLETAERNDVVQDVGSMKVTLVDVLRKDIQPVTREKAKKILGYLKMAEDLKPLKKKFKIEFKREENFSKNNLIEKILDELVKRGWIREN